MEFPVNEVNDSWSLKDSWKKCCKILPPPNTSWELIFLFHSINQHIQYRGRSTSSVFRSFILLCESLNNTKYRHLVRVISHHRNQISAPPHYLLANITSFNKKKTAKILKGWFIHLCGQFCFWMKLNGSHLREVNLQADRFSNNVSVCGDFT